MARDGFAGYAYAYPHKTSYRVLDPPIQLADAWCPEDKSALFLYVHLPFCEMRCGFCNLFTTTRPQHTLVEETINAIDRQSRVVANAVQPERISQVAIGGGTPSFLTVPELERLLGNLTTTWPLDWMSTPISFEVSPATVDDEKLALLKSHGIDRISMGVQSFTAADLKELGRSQSGDVVEAAISRIRDANFPVFNLDLIYGAKGQTHSSWQQTVEKTIEVSPEEVYLYPLYVRELTGLGRTGKSPGAHRRELFLSARELLRAAGYQQYSMRLFRRTDVDSTTDHCCQDDGMIGLGPGARSYTRSLHYSSEYAVGQSSVKRIIAAFNHSPDQAFAVAGYGTHLCDEEQRRRYVIKSLLRTEGVNYQAYQARFASELVTDFPQLGELVNLELGKRDGLFFRLTADGLSWSDVIGPWLYSAEVTSRMEAFELT